MRKAADLPHGVAVSRTAYQTAFAARWRRAAGLTGEERALLREGGVVLFDSGAWSRKGENGTKWREAYFIRCGKFNRYMVRVPSEEVLALIGETMVYGPRNRREKKGDEDDTERSDICVPIA